MHSPSMLEQALGYASRDWAVFPVYEILSPGVCSCRKGNTCGKTAGKHPRISGGHNAASTDPEQIHAWWTQWPDANIGIRTGEVSNLTVWDFDTYKPDATLPEELGDWPDTLTVRSGNGGLQFYFQHAHTAAKGIDAFPSVDIKSDGGYVVAPPSLRTSGNPYTWVNRLDVAEMPPWLVTLEGQERSQEVREPWSPSPLAIRTSSYCESGDVEESLPFRGWSTDLRLAEWLGFDVSTFTSRTLKVWCRLHNDGARESAWLTHTEHDDILFSCIHEGGFTLTLPQLYVSLRTRVISRFKEYGRTQALHMTWRLRLMFDAGLLPMLPIRCCVLPEDAPPTVQIVYNGAILLCGLKDHIPSWRDRPQPYSWRFAAAWCGVSEWTARQSMKWLLEHDYLSGTKITLSGKRMFGKDLEVFRPVAFPSSPVHLINSNLEATIHGRESDQDRDATAVSVVQGTTGLAEGAESEYERSVQPVGDSDVAGQCGLERATPDPDASLPVRVRSNVRKQAQSQVPPGVSKSQRKEAQAKANAEVAAVWRDRVYAGVDA